MANNTHSSEPEYSPHPFAEIFPPMAPDEREALEKSIKDNGLREKILVDRQDRILDGLNRYRACIAVGVTPEFEVFADSEEDARELIWIRNVVRRHLSISVKAAISAEWAQLERGQRPTSGNSPMRTDEMAGKANISTSSITAARRIKRVSGELHAAVKAGAISVNAAENIVCLPEPERAAAITEVAASIKQNGERVTKKAQRARDKSALGARKPNITMVGTDPLTGMEDQPLRGYFNILLHVTKAIPKLTRELRNLAAHTKEHALSPERARELRGALCALKEMDFDDLRAAANDAVQHLDVLTKEASSNSPTATLEEVAEIVASASNR